MRGTLIDSAMLRCLLDLPSTLSGNTIAGTLGQVVLRRRDCRMLLSQRIQTRFGACWLHIPSVPSTRRHLRTNAVASAECAVDSNTSLHSTPELCRRSFIGSAAALTAALCLSPDANAAAKRGADDLVEFVPDGKKTPSLRAGSIDPANPYRFSVPNGWKEERVANIQSGNFCAPRCDEPWTEVIFSNPSEGSLKLIVAPLRRLTSKDNASIDQVGDPNGVMAAIGPFLTGTSPPDEEEILSAETKEHGGRKYYVYDVNSAAGPVGPHLLTSCTTKNNLAYIFLVSANERQWTKSQAKLKKVIDTFQA